MRVRSRRKTVVFGSSVRSMTSASPSSSPRLWKALRTSHARSTVCDSLRSPRRLEVPRVIGFSSFATDSTEVGFGGVIDAYLRLRHPIFRVPEFARIACATMDYERAERGDECK